MMYRICFPQCVGEDEVGATCEIFFIESSKVINRMMFDTH